MNLSKHSNGFYYIYFIQDNGKRNSISTRTKIKAEALKFLSDFKKEFEKRKLQKLISVSLNEYCERFLSYSQTIHTSKTQKAYRSTLDYFKAFLGNITLNEITHSKMNDYFEQRIKNGSIYQARKDLICINSLFNKAIAEGHILQNPCKDIKRFRLPQKQPLFFTELEFDLLISKVKKKDLKDLFVFAIQSGLRLGELVSLQWNQIDFQSRLLTLTNQNHLTKSKKIRTLPLSIKALQILTERERNKNGDIVFTYNRKPINPNYLSGIFKSYVREAKVNPNLSFHSLRHSFASWLVQRGISIFQISKLLGHCNVSVTEIYSHLRAEDLRSAIDKLNN